MASSPHSTIVPSDSDINDAISSFQVIIALPAVLPPSPVLLLSLMFDSQDSFPSEKISSPKDTETPISSSVESSSLVRHQESSKQDPRTQGRTTILDLSRIQPLDRTSTSAAPTMTQDAIRQLVADSVAAALEAQAATMANTNNTNRNTGTSRTLVARKGTNDHKRKFDDRRNTTTNNENNNYSNNRNNNNYQDNHNNHNCNNDYHQQQNKRQETIRTYAATPTEDKRYTKKYHGNLPLCTRCTLHHTGVCTVRCQTCNKVGHQTRN
ncbi:hypothetical protein Tco_0646232 [Tanacetum coccineum]